MSKSEKRAISKLQRDIKTLQAQFFLYSDGDHNQITTTVDQWNQKVHKYIRLTTLGFTEAMLISIPDRNTDGAIFTSFVRVGDVLRYQMELPVRTSVDQIVRSIDPFRGIVWLMNTSGVVTNCVHSAYPQNVTIKPSLRQNWNVRGTPVIFPAVKVRFLEERFNPSHAMRSDKSVTSFIPSHRCNILGVVENPPFKGVIVENWSKTQIFYLTASECRGRIDIPAGASEPTICQIERLIDSNCSISIGDQVAIYDSIIDAALLREQLQVGEVVEIISHRYIFYNYWVMVDIPMGSVKIRRCILNRNLRIINRGYKWNTAFELPTVCHQWTLLENTVNPHNHFSNGTKIEIVDTSSLWHVRGCFVREGDSEDEIQIIAESITNPYRENRNSGFGHIDDLVDEWKMVRVVPASMVTIHCVPSESSQASSLRPSPIFASPIQVASLVSTEDSRMSHVTYPTTIETEENQSISIALVELSDEITDATSTSKKRTLPSVDTSSKRQRTDRE